MKKLTFTIVAVLIAVLLPQAAVRAAEQEKVILTAEQKKAGIEIEIPDVSEGVSTLRLRVNVEMDGNTNVLNADEPLKFEVDKDIRHSLLETRYNAENGYFTIYISKPSEIIDRSVFQLGYIVPNIVNSSSCTLTVTVPEDGLEYVDGTGQLNEVTGISPSSISLTINQSTEESPDGSTGGNGDGTTDGSGDGNNEGNANGNTSGASDGSGSDQAKGSASGNSTDNSNEKIRTAVKTGDDSGILLFFIMGGLSAVVLGIFVIKRLRKKTA